MNDDTISRQAAIKALADDMPQTYTPDGSHYADDDIFKAQEIYADCIHRLEELPSAQPEQRWIPCSERLPTKQGRYLITQERHYGLYVTAVYFDGNEFFDEAVAWMSTPEPYKGGSK